MIVTASQVASMLSSLGFKVQASQEEDEVLEQDAEIKIGSSVVIQIAWGPEEPEYGVTIEPHRAKRKNSGFHHVGYFNSVDELVSALSKICPQNQPSSWKSLILGYLQDHESATLDEMYKIFSTHPKSGQNYQAKIRQTLQEKNIFRKIQPGVYALA